MKNIELINNGKRSWEWACSRMSIINTLVNQNIGHKPLKGLRLGLSLHVTKETSVLVIAAIKLGSQSFSLFCKSIIGTRGYSSISIFKGDQGLCLEG